MNTTHARNRFAVAAGRSPTRERRQLRDADRDLCVSQEHRSAGVSARHQRQQHSDFSRTSTAGSPLALPCQRFTAHSCATSPAGGNPSQTLAPLAGIFILCGEALPDSGIPTFRALWDNINAKRGYGWDENPWVWIIEFEVIHKNIDEALS